MEYLITHMTLELPASSWQRSNGISYADLLDLACWKEWLTIRTSFQGANQQPPGKTWSPDRFATTGDCEGTEGKRVRGNSAHRQARP